MSEEIAKAIKMLQKAMKNDPQYAYGWHANIACCCQDAGANYKIANDGASRFMKLCFGIKTKSGGPIIKRRRND